MGRRKVQIPGCQAIRFTAEAGEEARQSPVGEKWTRNDRKQQRISSDTDATSRKGCEILRFLRWFDVFGDGMF